MEAKSCMGVLQSYIIIGWVFITKRDDQVVRINAAINIMMTRMSELRGTMSISRCANRTAVEAVEETKCPTHWLIFAITMKETTRFHRPGVYLDKDLRDHRFKLWHMSTFLWQQGVSVLEGQVFFVSDTRSLWLSHAARGIEKQSSMQTLCDWNQFMMVMFQRWTVFSHWTKQVRV